MTGTAELRPAVFLDRDGTLNEERHYLYRREDWVWIPGVVDSLARLSAAGFALVVVTNQSGIARGMYAREDVDVLHAWVQEDLLLRAGIRFEGFYVCPHHPDFSGECQCRKPGPGMLLMAAAEHGLDLSASWMIGDKSADVLAGRAAGCRTVLVQSGYGKMEKDKVAGVADIVAADFAAATDVILRCV